MASNMPPGYLDWALKLSQANPNFNEAVFNPKGRDYNYGLAYQQDPSGKVAGNGHIGDVGKMPNHPTFSNESAYAPGNNTYGNWVEPLAGDTWRYNNPSRGLFYAPEQQAYQKPTDGMAAMAQIWQSLNNPKTSLNRFK